MNITRATKIIPQIHTLKKAFKAQELTRKQAVKKTRPLPEIVFRTAAKHKVIKALRAAPRFAAADPSKTGATLRHAQIKVAKTPARQLPETAPDLIRVGKRLILKKIAQNADMVSYVNYIKGKPTYVYIMARLNPGTALPAPSRFLENRRALVAADRDGVIKDSRFLNKADKKEAKDVMIASALLAAKKLNDAGIGLAIVTNQGGYEIGKMSFEQTVAINIRVSQQIADAGGHIDAIFICPFSSSLKNAGADDIDARKPAAGMTTYVKNLAAAKKIPTLAMIGDQRTDGAAGQGAGLMFYAVTDSNGRWQAELNEAERKGKALPKLAIDPTRYREVPDFATAVEKLLEG